MKDIIASTCVGIGQIAIGHPFDTALVLIQNKKKWNGLKFRQYYKGWKFPLANSVVNNVTVFPINERLQKYTHSYFASGFLSGLFAFPTVYGVLLQIHQTMYYIFDNQCVKYFSHHTAFLQKHFYL